MERVITLEEVATKTRVPLATLRYWRSTGGGPATFRLGRRVMAYESVVDSWIETEAAKDRVRQATRT
jgi:predicted DNA-binding transcriptional regulator AlpA